MLCDTHRTRPRHAVRTECLVLGEDGRRLGDRTLDVSWDGLAVLARGPARCGEHVLVSIRVPRSDFWIRGRGRVSRLIQGRRWTDEGPALGIRLERMHGMDRLLWGTALGRQPKTVARRGGWRDYAEAVRRIAREG